MKRIPSLLRVIEVDYIAQLGVLLPVVIWGMTLVLQFIQPDDAPFFRALAMPLTVVGLGLLLWRNRLVTQTYEDGSQAEGVVTNIGFFRGRGRIHYVYTAASEKYLVSNAINASRRARAIQPGQRVTVTYSRHEPKRAFVDELYL
jgi:hypothetical protein